MNRTKKWYLVSLLSLIFVLAFTVSAFADCKIVEGKTPIVGGQAGNNDITLSNDKIAVSFARETGSFWGMSKGSILDIALMNADGTYGNTLVNDIEFLVDEWSGTYHASGTDCTITKLKETADECQLQMDTKFLGKGMSTPLDVTSIYTLRDGSNIIEVSTVVTNPASSADVYTDYRGGYSITRLGGKMFGPYGFNSDGGSYPIQIGEAIGEPFGDSIVNYNIDAKYAISMQVNGVTTFSGGSGYKDMYTYYTLNPGESKNFSANIQVEASGKMTPFIDKHLEKSNEAAGTLTGLIESSTGAKVENAVVIVEKEGSYIDTNGVRQTNWQTFDWDITGADGKYTMNLPAGDYIVYPEAIGYAKTDKIPVTVATTGATVDFTGANALALCSAVKINVIDAGTKDPVPARIDIAGTSGFLAKSTYFTDLNDIGSTTIMLSPGEYTVTLKSGVGFESEALQFPLTVEAQKDVNLTKEITSYTNPSAEKWYSADLHHHSNLADGASTPEDIVKSQIANRLDYVLVSDHDLIGNFAAVNSFAKLGKVPFLPSEEVSPTWGHWGVLTMPLDAKSVIDPTQTAREIVADAHALGAMIVVNHPYINYGYFFNRANPLAGEFATDFDFLEIQPSVDLSNENNVDKKTLNDAMAYWTEAITNGGNIYYLTGSSDTHDVTSQSTYSGVMRTFVNIDKKVTTDNYLSALKAGHSYISGGPLLYPENFMFGDTQIVKSGDKVSLNFDTIAVDGLSKVEIYSDSEVVASQNFANVADRQSLSFELTPDHDTWYNVVVYDKDNDVAISDPLWIDVQQAGDKVLSSIEVTPPTKTVYAVGESLDTTGMVVTAVYDDGTTKDVTEWASVTGFTSSKTGSKTILVTYLGDKDTFKVQVVKASTVVGLRLDPDPVSMVAGETVALKIYAVTAGGDEKDITSKCSFKRFDKKIISVKKGVVTALQEGTSELVIKYKNLSLTTSVIVSNAAGSSVQ